MSILKKCIVKNEKFQVTTYSESIPDNCVLTQPDKRDEYFRYVLANLGILVSWQKVWPSSKFKIFYKNIEILSINQPNIQSIVDHLNKFESISKEELLELYEEALDLKKSELEKKVESLQNEKEKLVKDLNIYRRINRKREEIKELVKELEDEDEI